MFLSKLCSKFIKPAYKLKHFEEGGTFADLECSMENEKDDGDLSVGFVTKSTLRKLYNEGDVTQQAIDKFYDAVRCYYTEAFNYCIQWLPLNDEIINNTDFIDFNFRASCNFDQVETIVASFPRILKEFQDRRKLDSLEEEFCNYQQISKEEIPQHVWDEACVQVIERSSDDGQETVQEQKYHRMDIIWGFLRNVFPLLSKVALAVLTIPHSNAAEERVFSMIRKNKTEFRPRLDADTTLGSIMSIKMNSPESLTPCYKFKPSTELLKKLQECLSKV